MKFSYLNKKVEAIETIENDTDRDNFMTAEEALQYGLIDGIMHPDGTVEYLLFEERKAHIEDNKKKKKAPLMETSSLDYSKYIELIDERNNDDNE